MQPNFLLEDEIRRESGVSQALEIGRSGEGTLLLTLGITRIVQQESLDVSVQGSPDGVRWEETPLAVFPRKHFCGTYSIVVDLSRHRHTRYLRVVWNMSRWGYSELPPLFSFYVWLSPLVVERVPEAELAAAV